MKVKLISAAIVLTALLAASYNVSAQSDLIGREILSGNLGDCPSSRPCSHRITGLDTQLSGGVYLFRADSQSLCYPQHIAISKNGSLVFSDTLSATDSSIKNIAARTNDLLLVSVTPLPLPFPNCDPKRGTLHWAIYR